MVKACSVTTSIFKKYPLPYSHPIYLAANVYVILNVMLAYTIVFNPESYRIYDEYKGLISIIDFEQISMNVQVA